VIGLRDWLFREQTRRFRDLGDKLDHIEIRIGKLINTIDDLERLLDRETTSDGRLIQMVIAQAATIKDYASQLATAQAANSPTQMRGIIGAMMEFAKAQEQEAIALAVPPLPPGIV